MKARGEEQSRASQPSAPRDQLVTELANAESDLQRIEAQHTAASARIAALRNELATLDATFRLVAAEPPLGRHCQVDAIGSKRVGNAIRIT